MFGGSRELKCIVQLMSASEAHRDVVFFPYDDPDFEQPCRGVSDLFQRANVTVGRFLCVCVPQGYGWAYCA